MFYYDASNILKNVVNPTRSNIQPFKQTTIRIPKEIDEEGWVRDIIYDLFNEDDYGEKEKIEYERNKEVIYTDDYYLSLDGNLLYNVYENEQDGKVKFLIELKVPQSISNIDELKERLSIKLKNNNELLIKIQKDEEKGKDKETKYKKKLKSFTTKINKDLKLDIVQYKKKTKTNYEKTQEINDVKFIGFEKGVMKVEFDIGSSDEIVDIKI